jgi:hypothetical protein
VIQLHSLSTRGRGIGKDCFTGTHFLSDICLDWFTLEIYSSNAVSRVTSNWNIVVEKKGKESAEELKSKICCSTKIELM